MRLELKAFDDIGRSMYVIHPDGDLHSCYENTLVTVLRETDGADELENLIKNDDFCALANHQRMVLLFPNPQDNHWDASPAGKDLADVNEMLERFHKLKDFNDHTVYHNMHNARYMVGFGQGATLVNTFAVSSCVNLAGIFTVGGRVTEDAKKNALGSAVSAILWNTDVDTVDFFKQYNETDVEADGMFKNSVNGAQFVMAAGEKTDVTLPAVLTFGWQHLFSKVCRPNTTEYGVMDYRLVRDDYKFIVHENDARLGDNSGLEHTWFEYVPECVRENPDKKVPLMIFSHGALDTPGNMANTTKLHLEAEKNGFLLVFTWSSDRWMWNIDMEDTKYDDIAYLKALIDYMKKTYPVDETQVFMGGFSNGSAMSQIFAMTNPELVAGVFANNTMAFQNRNTKPFAIAGAKKLQFDYRMPVWYIYGTRDIEYPAVRGSGQQVQYDFWKAYNNISFKQTPYSAQPDPSGVGVPGDVIEEVYPSPQFPKRKHTTHRFFSVDEKPLNLYNYTLVEGKGHDANPEEAGMAWNFLRKFYRMPDGRLGIKGE